MWTNADAVDEFLEAHTSERYKVGETLVLPDIEQRYTVLDIRAFKHGGKFRLFVDLEAVCAVDGCEEMLLCSKEVNEWRTSRYLVRSCPTHRRVFQTPMRNAWRTSLEIAALPPKREKAFKPKKVPEVGAVQQVVLDVLGDMVVVSDRIHAARVVEEAVRRLPSVDRGRDTRRQRVVRALQMLSLSGRVLADEGEVWLA